MRVLGAAAVALQTGIAIYEDIRNGGSALLVTSDAVATVVSNLAVLASPQAAAADLLVLVGENLDDLSVELHHCSTFEIAS